MKAQTEEKARIIMRKRARKPWFCVWVKYQYTPEEEVARFKHSGDAWCYAEHLQDHYDRLNPVEYIRVEM